MESVLQQLTRGKALLLILVLGAGGSFHSGYHLTGLSSPSPFIQSFINNTWSIRHGAPPPAQTVTMIWSLIVSLYAVGGLLGACSFKLISGGLGRKKAVIFGNLVSMTAAGVMVTSKMAESYEMIIVSRILSGYAAGLGGSSHAVYLGEISPPNIRGTVTLTFATFGSFGKLSGRFFGLSEILGREDLWNVVLCVPMFLSLVSVVLLPFLPEAPRYLLIEKGDDAACKKALQSLWGPGDYKEEMDEMMAEQTAIESTPPKSPLQLLSDRAVRWQLISMSCIYICNQLSGMSMISTFSFDIFEAAGIPGDKIRYVTLGLGVSEILTTISCGLLIEHTGRRPLLWGGYGLMSVCWVVATITLKLKDSSYWVPYVTAALIFMFIIIFCGGPSGATVTLNSELFIQSNRVAAQVLMGIQRWLTFAVMGLVFPFLINLSPYCFVLFACMCALGCLYSFFILPETKGKTLLQISEDFKAITVCGRSFTQQEDKKRAETRF